KEERDRDKSGRNWHYTNIRFCACNYCLDMFHKFSTHSVIIFLIVPLVLLKVVCFQFEQTEQIWFSYIQIVRYFFFLCWFEIIVFFPRLQICEKALSKSLLFVVKRKHFKDKIKKMNYAPPCNSFLNLFFGNFN
ncbi:hypothetical protein RFI_30153, partial [Reticulomyxa filosa]